MKEEQAAIFIHINKLKPSPDNPRINKHAIRSVANSIKLHGFAAPIVANFQNEILAGHTRWYAMQLLQKEESKDYSMVPVRQVDITGKQAMLYRISDNKLGELATWNYSKLEEQLKELSNTELDLNIMGFSEQELNSFLFELDENDPDAEWVDMPEFTNEDISSSRRIIVHFENDFDVQKFANLVKQKITDKTKFIWYPYKEDNDFESKRF